MGQREGRAGAEPLFRPVVVATTVGLLFTLAVVASPDIPLATRSPALQAMVETANGLITLFAALVVHGRFRAHPSASTGLLMTALLTFSLSSLAFGAIPGVAEMTRATCDTWGSLGSRSAALAIFAAAPFAGDRRRVPLHLPITAALAITLLASLACTRVGDGLTQPAPFMDTIITIADLLVPTPVVVLNALGVLVFLLAALGYRRRTTDRLWQGLAAAAVLGAFGRLHQLLVPSLYTGTVYSGDLLRIAFHGAVLLAAVGEITRYWQDREVLAVAEERRRLARDLHDGMAQELSFITTTAAGMAAAGDNLDADRIASAGRRALDEARRAIAALTRPPGESLGDALLESIQEIGARTGRPIAADVDRTVTVSPEQREELLRIAREAIGNALRHSACTEVRVTLHGPDPIVLTVDDDGTGFEPEGDALRRGFGLTSMRERAVILGADIAIRSGAGSGTSIVVTL